MRQPIDDLTKEETTAIAYTKAFEQVLHILDAIKNTLDTEGTECSECSTHQKNDWRQFQASESLTGAITRITKASFLIDQSTRLPVAHNAQQNTTGDADNG